MKIKLTKTGIDKQVMLSGGKNPGTWLTNGCWAIKRDLVDNGGMMTTPGIIDVVLKLKKGTALETAPDVDQLLISYDPLALRRFTFTGWLKQTHSKESDFAYCYEAENGEQLFLNQKHVDMFSPLFDGTCYAVSNYTQCYSEIFENVKDITVILMPLRTTTFEVDKMERAEMRVKDTASK